ncbi:porin [Bradyrhizobium pachyrhizi]|uniref:porin n=1 Tax=Bradyrhizobium pachyrhizi TaxID=280333 RepID=UPI003D361100
MKMVKRLVLGSAAGLVSIGGVQAADLPVKAKAVEYVRICSLYGAGFYYIPGSDTCIKLGGYARADVVVNSNSDNTGNVSGPGGAKNRFTNAYTWRARENLSIDTRTATEYGVLRTFAELTFTWTTDSYAGIGGGATAYAPIGTVSGPYNANGGNVAYGTLGVYHAFIQFAGFTMGKAVSQFSAPWTNFPGNNFDGLVGGGGGVTGVNQFSYTADFGSGMSLALSAQDQTAYYQAGVLNVSAGGPFGASDYAGTIAPDLVAAFRVDQAWGLFQASFAAHDNHAAYYTPGFETNGHPADKWGWAGQLALSIKNVPTGPADSINVQAVYTDGATRYNIQDLAGAYGAVALFGNSGLAGAYQSVAINAAPDTVFGLGTDQHTIKTWGGRGAFNHNWDPYWSSSLYGAYAAVRYDDASKVLICGSAHNGAASGGAFFTVSAGAGACNPDYNIGQLGFITRWTPVKNLTFSADLTWSHIDQKNSGTIAYPGSTAIGKPAGTYELKNQDNVLLLLRAQRNW